jgi:hypothetical protein
MNILLSPTIGQISAQVDVVLRHDADAAVVGIRAQSPGHWPDKLTVKDREFALAWCPSPIAVREKLLECETEETGMVILTPVDDQSLGADVLARLSRGRVFAVDSWDMLRNVFQARELDARLARWPWLAEALLENLPTEGYPPAQGGFLDVDSAWAQALQIVLHLSGEHSSRPDLLAALKWSLDFARVNRYASLAEQARQQVAAWLGEAMGASGKLALQCIHAGFASDLAPLGVVCGVVFHQDAAVDRFSLEDRAGLAAAAVRLEKYFGGLPVYADDGIYLYRGVQKLLDGLDQTSLDRVLEAADRLLESLHLTSFAALSNDLPSGFEARLTGLGEAIRNYLDKPGTATAAAVYSAADDATRHRLSSKGALRKLRMGMAAKLIRRLEQERQQPQATPADLPGCVSDYTRDGAFIDWARLSLLGGDELPGLTQGYKALRERVRGLRERQNSRFAESLGAWQDTGCSPVAGVLPVEQILSGIVAPLAGKIPVLLLVVDGLSYPIFLEIVDDALKNGWNEVLPAGQARPHAGLAAIPSVTEISRASLLCGRLCAGQAAQEKAGFSTHPALTAVSRGNAKPVVFHKGEIADGMGLSDAVRDVVGKPERRVVAVVYNGVDDHLSGSDQLQPHWNLDDLRLIRPLLYEARLAGRVVIMTSDHGHVLDEASAPGGIGIGDRWRACETAPGPLEKQLEGGRVLAPNGGHRVVVPWSESLRYAQKKNGYHGGISLQEMVVPICILTAGESPAGYRLAGPSFPDWWECVAPPTVAELNRQAVPRAVAAQPVKPKKPAPFDGRQKHLFDDEAALEPLPSTAEDWIGPVLASGMFQSQKQLAARAALKDGEIRNLLEALAERGGKMSKAALAQRLGLPLLRISGFINAARRLLNVDQANVLALDEAEGSITLNRVLLETQFKDGQE